MPRKNAVQHGTPQGYRKHLKKDSDWGEPCDECRAAQAAVMQDYRSRKKRSRSNDTQRATARRRALNRMAELDPLTFDVLFAEELNKIGASR